MKKSVVSVSYMFLLPFLPFLLFLHPADAKFLLGSVGDIIKGNGEGRYQETMMSGHVLDGNLEKEGKEEVDEGTELEETETRTHTHTDSQAQTELEEVEVEETSGEEGEGSPLRDGFGPFFDSILTNGLLTASSRDSEKPLPLLQPLNLISAIDDVDSTLGGGNSNSRGSIEESSPDVNTNKDCTDLQLALLHESQRNFAKCVDSIDLFSEPPTELGIGSSSTFPFPNRYLLSTSTVNSPLYMNIIASTAASTYSSGFFQFFRSFHIFPKFMGRRISRNLRIRAQEQEPNLFGGNLLDDENDSELTNCLMDGKENLLSCLRTYLPHTHLHESSKVSSKKKKEYTPTILDGGRPEGPAGHESNFVNDEPPQHKINHMTQYCSCFHSVASSSSVSNSLNSLSAMCEKASIWSQNIATAVDLCYSTDNLLSNLQELGDSISRNFPVPPPTGPFGQERSKQPKLFPFLPFEEERTRTFISPKEKVKEESYNIEDMVIEEAASTVGNAAKAEAKETQKEQKPSGPPRNPHPLGSSTRQQVLSERERNRKRDGEWKQVHPQKSSSSSSSSHNNKQPLYLGEHHDGKPTPGSGGKQKTFHSDNGMEVENGMVGEDGQQHLPPPPLMFVVGGFVGICTLITLIAFIAYKRGQASTKNGRQNGRREARYAQVITMDGENDDSSHSGSGNRRIHTSSSISEEEEEEARNARIISNIQNFVIDDENLDEDEIMDRVDDDFGNLPEQNLGTNINSSEGSTNTHSTNSSPPTSGTSNLAQVELTAMPTATAVPLV